jgi:hypothetical protein
MRCCKKAPQGRGVGSNCTTEPQPAKVDVTYDVTLRLLYSYGRVPGLHLREQDLGSVSRVPADREKDHANRPSEIRIRNDAHGTDALRLCRPPAHQGGYCTNRNCRAQVGSLLTLLRNCCCSAIRRPGFGLRMRLPCHQNNDHNEIVTTRDHLRTRSMGDCRPLYGDGEHYKGPANLISALR